MGSQTERDEVTVTIATSHAMLLGVFLVGGAAVGLVAWVVDLPERRPLVDEADVLDDVLSRVRGS